MQACQAGFFHLAICFYKRASQVGLVAKILPANVGDIRDAGSIPGSGRTPGGGHGNLVQYSRLEDPMDRGTWWVTVHGVAKNRTRLNRLSMHTSPAEVMGNKFEEFGRRGMTFGLNISILKCLKLQDSEIQFIL